MAEDFSVPSAAAVVQPVAIKRHKPLWRRGLNWVLAVSLLFVGWRTYDIFLGGNFHAVVENQCYRGAQPSAADLVRFHDRYKIRTVINLRGLQDDGEQEQWYPDEIATCKKLGIDLRHVGLWSHTPPEVPELEKLVNSLSKDQAPFFIHCHSGSDRTGLAATLYLLLRTDASVAEARRQLALYYGHFPLGRAQCHDRFFDFYQRWLDSEKCPHSPDALRKWAKDVYPKLLTPDGQLP